MLKLIFVILIPQIFVSGFLLNREELFISRVYQDPNFQSKISTAKWKTLNTGLGSFTVGVTKHMMMNLLFANVSAHDGPTINSRIFDLQVPIDDFDIFQIRSQVYMVVHVPGTRLEFYTLTFFAMEKFWTWPMEHPVSAFVVSKNQKKWYLFASVSSREGTHFVAVYRFNVSTKTYWYQQSISLAEASPSICLSSAANHLHLSIAQPASHSLAIYHLVDQGFVLLGNLPAPQINQVVCFEIGFKHFLAFNGLEAGILEISGSGLVAKAVVTSNFHGLDFWLPITINTYRDETVLLLQRTLNHSTHRSFDVDAVTLIGNRFEAHADVPCTVNGDVQGSLSCLAELSPSKGILGASYIAIGDHLWLVVPTEDQTPVLFSVEVGIKKNEHPRKRDLQFYADQKKKFELMMENGRKLQSPSILDGNNNFLNKLQEVLEETEQLIQKLKTNPPELKLNTLIFNGPVEATDHLSAKKWDSQKMANLLRHLARKDQLNTMAGQKVFHNLTVETLTAPTVNGVAARYLAKTFAGKVEIFGHFTFQKLVEAGTVTVGDSLVNNVPLSQFVPLDNISEHSLKFEELVAKKYFSAFSLNRQEMPKFQFLEIPGNVKIRSLNGEHFEDFLRQICLDGVECYVDKLKLIGKMDIRKSVATTHLDGLGFPEEFVQRKSEKPLLITGRKYFQNHISGSKVITPDHTVNDEVDFKKVITGNTDQNITGNFGFDQLEVVHDLDVKKNALQGFGLLKPNLGLDETAEIHANAEFLDLEVLGDVIVKTEDFRDYLENFVSKHQNATITGPKTFQRPLRVNDHTQICSGMINKILLNFTLTKNSEQSLEITIFNEKVQFEHVVVHGLFHQQNISALHGELISLNGNHTVSSELVFDDFFHSDRLIVEDFKGSGTVGVEGLILEQVGAERVEVKGHIRKVGLQEGTMNFAGDQSMTGDFFFSKVKVESFTVGTVNGVAADQVLSPEKFSANVTDILTYRNASVDGLSTEQNMAIHQLNSQNFNSTINNHPWKLLRQNLSSLVIEGKAHFFEALQITKLSNKNFEDYAASLVFKNQKNVTFRNSLRFQNVLIAVKLVETLSLNGVSLDHIFRTNGNRVVAGGLQVTGNVSFTDGVNVDEMVNHVHLTDVLQTLDFEQDALDVKGDHIFPRLPRIRTLTIHGLINAKHDFTTIAKDFVHLNHKPHLDHEVVFRSPVNVQGNFTTSSINHHNFSQLFSRAVWTTKKTNLEGAVSFTHPLECMAQLNVKLQLTTRRLFNRNLQRAVAEGTFVDKGKLDGAYFFDAAEVGGKLSASLLNHVDLKLIVPLKSAQNISRLSVADLQVGQNVAVGRHVNGKVWMVEAENTFSQNAKQRVDAKIVFSNNVLVEKTVTADAWDNKSFSEVVTTGTDQKLTATFDFDSKVVTSGNLIVNGLFNEINLTSWEMNTIPVESKESQHAEVALKKMNFLVGGAKLDNYNSSGLPQKLKEKGKKIPNDDYEKAARHFKDLCKNVTEVHNATQNQLSKFQYFEESQTLQFPATINHIKPFRHGNDQFLLVSMENSCFSELWKLLPTGGYAKIKTMETGSFSQIELVVAQNLLFLVTRSPNLHFPCSFTLGTILWKWINEELQVITSLPTQELLQSSIRPRTFYGLARGVVTEFRVNAFEEIETFRKWNVAEENCRFAPRGFKTGLVVSTGTELIYLHRGQEVTTEETKQIFPNLYKSTIFGNFTKTPNRILPGRNGSEFVLVPVGFKAAKFKLQAVTGRRETEVFGSLDGIEIYSDSVSGKLFDAIFAHNLSSVHALDLENGETLLAFIENRKFVQIYEYKGLNGFKHRSTIKSPAQNLFVMQAPSGENFADQKVLGLVHKNKVTLFRAVIMTAPKVKNSFPIF